MDNHLNFHLGELGYNVPARESKNVRPDRSTLYQNKNLSTDCSVNIHYLIIKIQISRIKQLSREF